MSLFARRKSKLLTPLLFSAGDTTYYLKPSPQGLALYKNQGVTPLYQLQEQVHLAHGAITNSRFHLVVLKANGDLCYTLIPEKGPHQTTVLTTLDTQSTTYRRLFVFPIGKMVHIFYAYAHLAIRDLWYIEHLYWDGKLWRTVRLGEVTHTRAPLFQVSQDSEGHLHLLTMTFQGQYSLLMSNRFNRTFMLWGNPIEALKIHREVIDMASIMTPDNVHHLFYVAKTPHKQLELAWAHRPKALDFSTVWNQAPSPIKTLDGNWQGLGAIEQSGILWLLVNTDLTTLFSYEGQGWKAISSQPSIYQPILWTHRNVTTPYISYWLEEKDLQGIPAFSKQLGFPYIPKSSVSSPTVQIPQPQHQVMNTPVQIPELYYSRLNSLSANTQHSSSANTLEIHPPVQATQAVQTTQELPGPFPRDPSEHAPQQISQQDPTQSLPLTPIEMLQDTSKDTSLETSMEMPSITSSIISSEILTEIPPGPILSKEKDEPSKSLHTLLISEKSTPSTEPARTELARQFSSYVTETLDPLTKTVVHLQEKNRNLTTILETVLSKHLETTSSLQKIEDQITEMQHGKESESEKGFWSKWFK